MKQFFVDHMVQVAALVCVQRLRTVAMVKAARKLNVLVWRDAELHIALALQVIISSTITLCYYR